MPFHADLLEQAGFLARREPRRPRQASLRRAISSAYYALFHMLASDATTLLPNQPAGLRQQARRVLSHSDMKSVCRQFSTGNIANLTAETARLVVRHVEAEISAVAKAFVDLQEARHRADYDLASPFARLEAVSLIEKAKKALADWHRIRSKPNATLFLAALLLQKHWKDR